MKVEILYFEGCPHHSPTVELVKEVLTECGLPAVPEQIEVRDAIEAERLCFPGSPTVRVDGEDIEAGVQDRREYALSCRMYGTAGVPPRELLLTAFRRGG